MDNKPSFFNSTFSLMTLLVVLSFTGLCLYLKDVSNLKEIAMFLLGAYGLKKGMEGKNGDTKTAQKEAVVGQTPEKV